ncbi:uncharacterized protein LOC133319450 [Danaus plexippus]|uniref:uncharacterized protein LOC133319450 n=1 Tax=Danaus plexippus TaxID=13037 RepID=UPI002AB2E437|nr:uncharacterized protein LOC133319450 [Danaus plexippus]
MVEAIVFFIIAFSLWFSLFLNFFLVYSVYCRLKTLRINVNSNYSNIVSFQYIYKFLIDSTERCQEIFNYLLIMILIVQMPEMMQLLYNIVKELKFTLADIMNIYDILVCIYALQYMIVIFLPALFATMLTNEAHKLKIVLHDMLLDERGSVHTHDIKRFIDYVDARPFRLRICNLIPLDYKYSLIIINVYVTYTIVIAQFSLTN